MKAEKKTGRKISIKWSIFGYLLIFIFILLAILWVMQTVYLESFYKNIKERELKSAVSQVVEVMNGSQYKDEIELLAKKNDIRVILGNSDGDRVYSTGCAATENISRMDSEQIKKLYKMAQDNGGEVHISSKKGLMDLSPRFDRPERRETVQEEDSGQSESRMMAIALIKLDFFLLHPVNSIPQEMIFSNTARIVEKAAKDINMKNKLPHNLPIGI